jgi:hypothetical protein
VLACGLDQLLPPAAHHAAVTSLNGGLGFGKFVLLVIAVTICRPFASLSVTDRFLRLSLTLAIRFSLVVDFQWGDNS